MVLNKNIERLLEIRFNIVQKPYKPYGKRIKTNRTRNVSFRTRSVSYRMTNVPYCVKKTYRILPHRARHLFCRTNRTACQFE